MIDLIPDTTLFLSVLIAFFAGVVKGVVGFALPMIMIASLSSLMDPELALAALLLPTLATNGWQALRQGPKAAWESVKMIRVFLGVGLIVMLMSAQLVPLLPVEAFLLMIGVPMVIFGSVQLAGWSPRLSKRSFWSDAGAGGIAGFFGGLSGVWGPVTVAYLTALGTEKRAQVRAQGAAFGIAAVLLVAAHVQSGVLRAETAVLSALLLPSALLGMGVGFYVQDRIDQVVFRKATLIVLVVASANLIRRALMG